MFAHTTPNKTAFQRFQDAANSHDPKLLSDTVDQLFDANVVLHDPTPVQVGGAQVLKETFAGLLRAFPDLHVSVKDMIEEGDKVVCRSSVTVTHTGEYMGLPATGKTVTFSEIFIFRFASGLVAEVWGIVDGVAQMKQLGMLPG